MSQTLFDAMKRSRNEYQTMLLRQIATSSELFGVMPFVPKAGEGFEYDREVSVGSFRFINPGGTVQESTGTTEHLVIGKREATADFYVPNFAQDNMGDILDPLEAQTRMKLKAAGRTLAGKFVTGASINGFTSEAFQSGPYVDALVAASPFVRDRAEAGELKYTHTGTFLQFRAPGDTEFGTAVACTTDGSYTLASKSPSKWIRVTLDVSDATADAIRRIAFTTSSYEFDGLQQLVAPSQVIDSDGAAGDALSFRKLRQLRDLVKDKTGLVAYVMHSSARQKYEDLVTATNGAGPQTVMLETFRAPTFDGYPILVDDNIPTTEVKGGSGSTLTSVYFANFEPDRGVFCGATGGAEQQVESDPRDRTVLGFRLRDLGQKAGESQQGRRLSWYGAPVCGSDLSLARASEISVA